MQKLISTFHSKLYLNLGSLCLNNVHNNINTKIYYPVSSSYTIFTSLGIRKNTICTSLPYKTCKKVFSFFCDLQTKNIYTVIERIGVNKHETYHVTSSKAHAKWRLNGSHLFNGIHFTLKTNLNRFKRNIIFFYVIYRCKSLRHKIKAYSLLYLNDILQYPLISIFNKK